ncbi:MAG: murein biosynthesis integral membrane protein MurJ [Acidobacteriota bacterium]
MPTKQCTPSKMARHFQAARATGTVSVAVLASRILGLVREQVMAALFGAGAQMDAWLVAFRIPNMLRDLFAEGALSSAFVPTFTDTLRRKGSQEAWLLANLVLNALMVLLGVLALIFCLFSDAFVYLLAGGFSQVPGKVELTSSLLRILSPFLLLIALASVVMGVLNTLNHFFLPALAPAFFNLSLILAGLLLVSRFEDWGLLGIEAIAVGAVVGGFLQFGVQLPLLRSHGFRYRFRLDFRHAGVLKIGRLLGPAVIGVSAVQINTLVNTQLASLLGDGPVSWLNYAFRLIYLPIGLFGVAVGIVNLREVSVLASQREWEELKQTVAASLRLIAFLSIPSSVGLMVLSVPIIQVIFERGHFTHSDTVHAAYALLLYSLGLFAYSGVKVYVPTFYALDDARTPVRISLVAVAVNVVVNLLLVFVILPAGYQYVGLALGTSLSLALNFLLLARGFRRRLGPFEGSRVGSTLLKTVLASLMMGTVVYLLYPVLEDRWAEVGLLPGLVICIGAGGVVYFLCCRVLGVEEVHYFLPWRRR